MSKALEIAMFMLIGAALCAGMVLGLLASLAVVLFVGYWAFGFHPLAGVVWVSAVLGAAIGLLAYRDQR